MVRFVVLVASVLVSSCATAPTGRDGKALTVLDAGEAPAQPVEAFRLALRTRLKDPDSALVRIVGEPRAVVVNAVPMLTNGGAGWRICAEVNAKNSYGGYVGYKRIYLLWNGGRVLDYLDEEFGQAACRNAEAE